MDGISFFNVALIDGHIASRPKYAQLQAFMGSLVHEIRGLPLRSFKAIIAICTMRRRAQSTVIGTILFSLMFMAAIGGLVLYSNQQAQYNQVVNQAQNIQANRAHEQLTYGTFPNGTLSITNAGTQAASIVGIVIRFGNGSVYTLSPNRSAPANAALSVPALIPSGSTCGSSTCLAKYNTILASTNTGDQIGLITSLGNTFWVNPAQALKSGNPSTTYQTTFDASGAGGFGTTTVLTVDGTNYQYSQLPVTLNWFAGTRHTYTFQSLSAGTGTRTGVSSVTGLSTTSTATITATSAGTIRAAYTTQYLLTVGGGGGITTSPASPTGDFYYNSGTSVQVTTNYVWGVVSGQSRSDLLSWSLDGGANTVVARAGSGTFTTAIAIAMNAPHTVTFNPQTQYYLTVSGGNGVTYSVASQTSDGWYDSGTALAVSSNGVWGRSAGTGSRVNSWNVDGGANTNVATTGTVTTSSVIMSSYHTINFNSVTQYQVTLDAGATSALSGTTAPAISGDGYWYDSGTSVTYTGNGVFSRASGTGSRSSGWSIDSGASTSVSTTGAFSTMAVSMTAPHTVHVTTITQYQLTLSSGAASAQNTLTAPTISGDTGWYDSGATITYTGKGVFGRSAGTGSRVGSYNWDGGANTPVSTTGSFTASQTMAAAHRINVNTVAQYQLTLGASGVADLSSVTSPTISGDNYWYDSGTLVIYSGLGVYGRSGGAGTRASSWNWDGGANTALSTTAAWSSTVQTMSAAHAVNVNTVTQYQVTLDAASTSALSSTTTPSISGDNYWYDSGTAVSVVLSGVWGTSGTTRTRLATYAVNGGSSTTTASAGTITVLNLASIAATQSLTATSATQFQLVVNGGSSLAYVNSQTSDSWYDSGTAAQVTSNLVWSVVSGQSRSSLPYVQKDEVRPAAHSFEDCSRVQNV